MSLQEKSASPEGQQGDEAAKPRVRGGRSRTLSGTVCRGCGRFPEPLSPLDAVAVIRFLERRSASLFDHPNGTWSAMSAQVSDVFAAANRSLRELLGEEALAPVPTRVEASGWTTRRRAPSEVLAENVRRLASTIAGATAKDWYRDRPVEAGSAGGMIWLALHQATHHLEDAELTLDSR